jgi:hypothetical protein
MWNGRMSFNPKSTQNLQGAGHEGHVSHVLMCSMKSANFTPFWDDFGIQNG